MDIPGGLLDALIQVESSGNPDAYNPDSGATGLGQITPPALQDFNSWNKENYTMEQMKDPQKNMRVSSWYLYDEIPRLLKHYKLPMTIPNLLAAYNFGIGNLKNKKPLPDETKNYIKNITAILNAQK